MKRSTKHALTGYALLTPLLVGFCLFYAWPFGMVLRYSTVEGSGHSQSFVGLGHYLELLGNQTFCLALGNTVAFLLVGLSLMLCISYAIALFLQRFAKRSRALRSLLLLPYVMPVIGTVLVVDLLFSEAGLGNLLLDALGLPMRDFLHSDIAFWVVILLYLWKNVGYSVILILSGLMAIDDDQYAAAALDGAGRRARFLHITAPQTWYSVFFAGVFALINAFKSFREILLIGGDDPHESIYMLQHYINNCFEKLSYTSMAVASMLMALIVFIPFLICYRWVMRKEAYKE